LLRSLHKVETIGIFNLDVREVAADFVSAKIFESNRKVGQSNRERVKCPGHGVVFGSNLPKKANALLKG
jgi:hypothetical protein